MDSLHPKKLLIVNILDILKRYTDTEHKLHQHEIIAILERDYNMTCERKAVARNLSILSEWDCYDIEYDKGWYMNHEFDDTELRLIIDSIIFSKHIPLNMCTRLIEKIKGLSNKYFSARVANITPLYENRIENKQISFILEILDEAIRDKKQVEFTYNEFGADKKLHPRKTADGKERRYTINPIRIAATNGRYYLICNNDKYDSIANYRIDKITAIKLLGTPAKDHKKIKGMEQGLNLPKHLAEHIYMFSGESIPVTFRVHNSAIGDVIDWFGADTLFKDEGEYSAVTVMVNRRAMLYWAMQYAEKVEVLSPQSLRDEIKDSLQNALKKYE